MPIGTIITGVLAIVDYLIARAQAAGEDIPDELLEQRTALRRALAEQAQGEASPSEHGP